MDIQHERITQACRQLRIDAMGEQYAMLASRAASNRKLPRQADNALLESATVVSLGMKRRGGSPPRAS